MIKTLIEREVDRLDKKGYDAVVVTDEILMHGKKKVSLLGCDSAIVTGVYFDDDQMTNNEQITISSATSCICGSADKVASMGVNINKVMRQYISISRSTNDSRPIVVNIIKISPKQR